MYLCEIGEYRLNFEVDLHFKRLQRNFLGEGDGLSERKAHGDVLL